MRFACRVRYRLLYQGQHGVCCKNGSVVSTDVEDFDTAAYKQDDLQSYVDKSIDDYNKKNDGSIKLKKLTVEKKKASLTMSYASTDEYTDFNGTKLFQERLRRLWQPDMISRLISQR